MNTVADRLQGTISSRVSGFEGILSKLVAEACVSVLPKNPYNFNVDNVRVVKIPGGGLADSRVVKGMVFRRDAEGTIKHVENAKVAVFAQGVDTATTDTKVGSGRCCMIVPCPIVLSSAPAAKVLVSIPGAMRVCLQGTVLIKTAEELENYSKSEESKLEEYIKNIANTGVKVGSMLQAHWM
eukprot:1142380-Pelagomonas_calceolata.AAC.4